MQNIHQREEPKTLPDDEKGNHEIRVAVGQMSSSKQGLLNFCFGVIDSPTEQRGPLKVLWSDAKFTNVSDNNPQAQLDEGCRVLMKPSDLTSCGERTRAQREENWKRKESMGRAAAWLATLTFCLYLFSTICSRPLFQSRGPHSLLLAIIAMFNFTVLVSAASVMIVVGARCTRTQITMLLISAVTPLFA